MMKNLFFYVILSLITINSSLVSCRNSDDGGGDEPGTGGAATLTAQNYGFDGANAGAFGSTKAGIVKTTAAGMTILSISGIKDGGNESINMILYGDVTVGKTYSLGNGSQDGIVIRKNYQDVSDLTKSYSTDNDSPTMTGGGEVKITSISGNQIEGTFYAVAHNSTGSEAFAEQGKFSGTIN